MAGPQRSILRLCLEVWLLRLREEVQRNPAQTERSRPGQTEFVVGRKQGLIATASFPQDNMRTVLVLHQCCENERKSGYTFQIRLI